MFDGAGLVKGPVELRHLQEIPLLLGFHPKEEKYRKIIGVLLSTHCMSLNRSLENPIED